MSTYISSIGTAVPQYESKQQDIASFMAKAHNLDEAQGRKLKSLYRATQIDTRYSVLQDYTTKQEAYSFFPNTSDLEPFPTTAKRMSVYRKEAIKLSRDAIQNCLTNMPEMAYSEITHLITISCTGMYAPGLDIELVQELNLRPNTMRTAINFMGCYAAFNGLKVADAICKADKKAKVLMVAVELCTLHFQKEYSNDNLFANALFADGAAAVVLESNPAQKPALSIERFSCVLDENSSEDMAWKIGDHGFEMRLSAYVPSVIQKGINNLSNQLLEGIDLSHDEIDYYAIHPGGKKILDVIQQELGLDPDDTCVSREVLRKYGNMSSPTVLFVLQSILNKVSPDDHSKHIMTFAFGPGLTMESALLKIDSQ